MYVYLETSAMLSWLLQEPLGVRVGASLQTASLLVTSELTFAEAARALVRLRSSVSPADCQALSQRVKMLRASCHVLAIGSPILGSVGQTFPTEPVRTLDAIHLATALDLIGDIPLLTMCTLDHRVRDNWLALGYPLTL